MSGRLIKGIRKPKKVYCESVQEACRQINLTPNTYKNHEHRPGFPKKTKRGKVNARKVYDYFFAINKERLAKDDKKGDGDELRKQTTELKKYQAKNERVKYYELCGKLVSVDDVEELILQIGKTLSSKLNVLPTNLAAELEHLDRQEIEVVLRNTFEAFLSEVSSAIGEIRIRDGEDLINEEFES